MLFQFYIFSKKYINNDYTSRMNNFMNRCGNSTSAISLTQYCNKKANENAINYVKAKTSSNDPTITKNILYAQLVNNPRSRMTVTGAQYAILLANSNKSSSINNSSNSSTNNSTNNSNSNYNKNNVC